MFPVAPDAVEDILLCRVETLCRRRIDPALAGLGPLAGTRPVPFARTSGIDVVIASTGRFPPIKLLSIALGGSKLKSWDAVAMLLWRSSKLGDGRKS